MPIMPIDNHREAMAMGLGALAVTAVAIVTASATGPAFSERLSQQAKAAIAQADAAPVRASFVSANGWPTRHALLSGGEHLSERTRARAARAVGAIPGVGGVHWADGTGFADGRKSSPRPVVCQEDVAGLLRARTIRFEEGSAKIDQASEALIDEVSDALRPCLGSIIAVTGHTDSSGPEPGNLALSRLRADSVRDALIARGIPADGLRTRGVGSRFPVEGLEPTDPANRRIEFSVIATEPVRPTPVDTPGPR
ncbi:MAG TPA: OmpA family protein [Croceibacterium sp.]|nr:OmpA family protein [Croceibacterium sp.]